MSYVLREHTADVAVEATGPTLDATLAAVADGLTEAHCEDVPADVGERFSVEIAAESREALLFDYLDRLIYERDVRDVLPADHEVRTESGPADSNGESGGTDAEWSLTASARGVPFEAIDAREIKAVTYSEMELVETADGWRAYVVFDV